MCRHPAGGRQIGPIPVVGIAREIVAHERLPLLQCGLLTRGQIEFDTQVRYFDAALEAGRIDPLRRRRARLRGRPPAVFAPRVEEWREHLVGFAAVLDDPARRNQIWRPRRFQRYAAEGVANGVVASAAERSEVGRHMHGCGADGFGKRGNSRVRLAPSHHQPAVQSVAQFTQRVVEVLQPPRPGRRLQPGVQHVAGQHLTVRLRRVQQGRQVAQPQIPPEPQQSGHAIDAARISG